MDLDTPKTPPSQLKKHVATVHTSAALTLLQRKAFSVLVFHAYPVLTTQRVHEIPVPLFCDLLGFDSKNTQALEESLDGLAQTRINWEDGEGKSRKWSVTTFLSYAAIEHGVCRYEFSEFLAKELYKPGVYARINVAAVKEFGSKHALALYENCARYRPNDEFRGQTPQWPLDLFRRLMGVAGGMYENDFRRVNERVIKPAVKEVNANSDIAVEPQFKKRGRSVVAVSFTVRDNERLRLAAPPDAAHAHPLAAEALQRYRVPLLTASQWLKTYGEERFSEVLRMTHGLVAEGKAKSPVGFMRRAFEENYQTAPDPKQVKASQQKEKAKKKAEEEQRRKTEAERLRQQEEQLVTDAVTRFEALSVYEQQAIIDELSASNPFFRARYAQQGREGLLGGTLRIMLSHHLEEKWALRAKTQ
jgi:hypothetical protein